MPSEQRDREIEALRERLSRLSEASRRINESLDFDTVLQGVLDSTRSLTAARYGMMTLLDLLPAGSSHSVETGSAVILPRTSQGSPPASPHR